MAVCSEDIIEELREEQSNPQDSSYCVVGRHGVINSRVPGESNQSKQTCNLQVFSINHGERAEDQQMLSGQVNPMCPVSDELEDSSTVCSKSANESSPLVEQKGSPAKQGRRRITCVVLLCVCAGLLVIFAFGFGAFVLSFKHKGSVLAVKGDTVLITCSATWWILRTMKFLAYNVTLEQDSSMLCLSNSILIFMIPHHELIKSIQSRQWPLIDEMNSSLVDDRGSAEKLFFSNCSVYPNKCILEQYLYLVDSPSAFISFNIDLSDYIPDRTIVRASAFDSLASFQNYLNEIQPYETLKIFNADHRNWRFDLTSSEMRKSSYIFIIVEVLKGDVSWFTFTRNGQENYYNIKDEKPKCKLNDETHQCKFDVTTSIQYMHCFVAQFLGARSEPGEIPNSNSMAYISYESINFFASGTGICLVVLALLCAVVAVVIIISCIIYMYRQIRKKTSQQG